MDGIGAFLTGIIFGYGFRVIHEFVEIILQKIRHGY